MQQINWGIIGCGNVTEIKSGPAFNKVPQSKLVAVMRRNSAKAADYARRHNVPRWYDDAKQLIDDPEVNAIYVATPPSSHEEYAVAAINAGKPVYVEKPMTLNYAAAQQMAELAKKRNVKLTVAHYRREWPLFKKLRELIKENAIGDVRLANLQFYKPPQSPAELAEEKNAWRVNPAVSGGGLFHDLAPHQLDIMYYIFGAAKHINGLATSQGSNHAADDMVIANMLFKNNIAFSGAWCFNAAVASDVCYIIGSTGRLSFSFFSGNSIELVTNNETTTFNFERLPHVQQPMIEKTVQYFLDAGPNPCPAGEGAEVMRWMDTIVVQK